MVTYTKQFWKYATERAVKSLGQGALLYIGAEQLNVLDFDWATFGGFAIGAAFLSVLTSIASAPVGDDNSPSIV